VPLWQRLRAYWIEAPNADPLVDQSLARAYIVDTRDTPLSAAMIAAVFWGMFLVLTGNRGTLVVGRAGARDAVEHAPPPASRGPRGHRRCLGRPARAGSWSCACCSRGWCGRWHRGSSFRTATLPTSS
jgi:hypothetical protein